MKYIRYVFIPLALLFLQWFISCVSTAEDKIDSVYVMIYDYDNSEIMNVSVSIDGNEIGKTDIYGRLMFPSKEEKECIVKAEKEGYETVEIKTYIRPGQLVYFRLGTGAYYAETAEKQLDRKEYEMALKLVSKALEIEERKDWLFLKEVILRRLANEK